LAERFMGGEAGGLKEEEAGGERRLLNPGAG
jgi:hypothetical protein